jgi:alkanesulfonate monooxygenase SsuD/methylene tetrahydromethanopterin reductase-like flavin-dependent oxidoreductase (luciferase family)
VLRIGIGPFPLEATAGAGLAQVYADALDYAQLADRVGLDGVWADGNHFTDEEHGPSPMLVAGALAARTRRAQIGIATLTLTIGEHPLHVAEEALFLDALSGGRLVLGVGLGYREPEMRGFGVQRAERSARFDEALAIVRAAFADPPELPFHGDSFRVGAAVTPHPRPVRPGGPPIWVGGGWQAAAVRRVARLGAPLISQFFEGPEILSRKLALYREAAPAEAPGRTIVPAIRDVVVGAPAEVEQLLPALTRLYRRYAEWGMPLLGRPTRPEEIGPEETRRIALVGEAEEIRDRLHAVREAGVTDILARVDLPGIPRPTVERTIHTLAEIRAA